jgi:predicted RNA-binding protein with EMAP domain
MSFYRNFKSKDDLLSKSIEATLENLKISLQKEENLNQFIVTKEIFANTAKFKDVLQAFKNTDYLNRFIDSISERLFTFAPEDKINPTKKYIPIFYFNALAGVLGFWVNNGAKESPEDMAKLICSIADFPIFTDENIHIE